ncbi:MAG: hypothetical protein QHI48_05865 [Bacteroidota bacterium]|nr:hypothetical protein [Bacteroidota bacterium]
MCTRKMSGLSVFAFLAAFSACSILVATAQVWPREAFGDPSDVTGLKTATGESWSTYADVAQFYPSVALRLLAGEVAVETKGQAREEIRWDHPLSTQRETPYLPLYRHNSDEYANAIVTVPFTLGRDRRLVMFRDFGFRFPVVREDGSAVDIAQGAAEMNTTDTVLFSIELIDAQSGTLLETLDRIVIPPCSNWEDFVLVLARRTLEQTSPSSGEYPFLLMREPGENVIGRPVRCRLSASVIPVEGDRYRNRALYVRFQSYERLSTLMIDDWDSFQKDVEAVAENILAKMGKEERDGWLPVLSPRDAGITIYPAMVSASDPLIHAHRKDGGVGDEVMLTIADVSGRILHQEVKEASSGGNVSFRPPRSAFAAGFVFAFVRWDGFFNYSLIRCMK